MEAMIPESENSGLAGPHFRIGIAGRALPGENVSGDLHFVQPLAGGTLIGVVDGLGHGNEASCAARQAVECACSHTNKSLPAIIQACHDSIRSSRGVVMSLARFEAT